LRRLHAIEMGGPCRRVAGWMAVHAELLAVRVSGRRVPVVEDYFQIAIREDDRIGTLVEVALVLTERRIEEVAEEAERIRAAADEYIEDDAAEVAATEGVDRHRRVAGGVVRMFRSRTAANGVAVGIGGSGLLAKRLVQLLAERRQQVAPVLAVVGRPVDAA